MWDIKANLHRLASVLASLVSPPKHLPVSKKNCSRNEQSYIHIDPKKSSMFLNVSQIDVQMQSDTIAYICSVSM